MTRRTVTRRLRDFDLGKGMTGGPALIPRTTTLPPDPRMKHKVQCGIYEVTVLVAEGQLINEKKICKKFLKELHKKDNGRLK